MDWNLIFIILIIIIVGIVSHTLWIVARGFILILKLFYYIGVGAVWLVTLPFRRKE
jgi:hypothetical protein